MVTQTATELEILQPITVNAIHQTYHQLSPPAPRLKELRPQAPESAIPPASATQAREETTVFSKTRAVAFVAHLLLLNLLSSFSNGVIVVGLPTINTALQLEEGLLLWPTGGQLIAFRALQGISNAIIVPSSISIVSTGMRDGRPRNLGFACLGLAYPIGFSLGLVLGGVFIDTIGWRPAFYFVGAFTSALFFAGPWALPRDRPRSAQSIWRQFGSDIDWIGATIASVGLAAVSYVFSTLSADVNNIHQASSIALLIISAASIPAFIGWMHYRVKRNRTALIPNSLWRSFAFTSVCIMVLFSTSVTNCMELYSSLFFQEVQVVSPLGASLRILPSLIAGALISLSTGLFVNRVPVMWSVLVTAVISTVAPLLMAVIDPDWPYCCDVLFTVGLLVISDVFPAHTQALGGAVFNTCAQLGTAIGLSATSLISTAVTDASGYTDTKSPIALLSGYKAVFWTLFAWMVLVSLASVPGLRKIGRIGLKRD
ncbi:hypothetical protein NUW58_g4013 [Xylaria curta]|uniref:Uncharacterized protein n=1 Tax=Xylaria curta TaxID=42375 RepID=A0ACC1PBB5_9PEZI|nr:hypothetical protein NUW58_g4013 [Xylaria curta]